MGMTHEVHEAYEIIGAKGPLDVLLTCEHASNRLPRPWQWPEDDRRLIEMHWAIDIGAEALTRELAAHMPAVGVLARFTRLLVDPNRPLDSSTLFRTEADHQPVRLNQDLSDTERKQRIDHYYRPYHAAIGRCVSKHAPRLILAMHSFTPVYQGHRRAVEIGILHADQPEIAERWRAHLSHSGMDVRINEPYAGGEGFMFAPLHHAREAGIPALELELRQDIVGDPARRPQLVTLLADLLKVTML